MYKITKPAEKIKQVKWSFTYNGLRCSVLLKSLRLNRFSGGKGGR
jgi:hypothetical protein